MNALERVVAGAARTLKGIGGTSIVYVRRAFRSEPITAIRTVAEYRVLDAKTGMPIRVKYIDWLFLANDIVLDGQVSKPQPGDEIEAGSLKYSATPIEKRPCFEPHDAGGQMIIIHTTQIQ